MKNAKCTYCSLLLKQYDDTDCEKESQNSRDNSKEVTNDLVAMVKILQSKCRIKDGMIVALADELKGFDKSERIQSVLQKLADIDPDCQIIDFDRSTLWKYLVSKIEYSYLYRRKNIVDEKAHRGESTIGLFILIVLFLSKIQLRRFRCTAMFLFVLLTTSVLEYKNFFELLL